MRKNVIKIIIIIVSIIALMLLYVHLKRNTLLTLSKGEYLYESISPDNEYSVKVYLVNGGATVSLSIRCELVSLKTNSKKNIYWNYKCETANIVWMDNENVIINGVELNILTDIYDWRKDSNWKNNDSGNYMTIDFADTNAFEFIRDFYDDIDIASNFDGILEEYNYLDPNVDLKSETSYEYYIFDKKEGKRIYISIFTRALMNDTSIYLISIPKYDENYKPIEVPEGIRNQSYFRSDQLLYFFKVTQEQYNVIVKKII